MPANTISRDHILPVVLPTSASIIHQDSAWLAAGSPALQSHISHPVCANYDSTFIVRAKYSLMMLQTSWQPCSDVLVLEKGASPPAKSLYNMDSYVEYYCYLYRWVLFQLQESVSPVQY
ncbi:hypothetical protein MAP00_003873 [Monascus purpureus]|nr:hypothetical protein MAP00_003873 [Monascus purpureus]